MATVTLPGVFRPLPESRLLADVVCAEPLGATSRVLDLCTGSGIVALAAARRFGCAPTAVDLSRRAVATARLNARRERLAVRVVRGDLFGPLGEERFDLVAANPPYLPGTTPPPARGSARGWEGGRDGRALVDRIVREARARLRPGGTLLLLHSAVCGLDATLSELRGQGLGATVAARRFEPFGPLMRRRAADLRRRGLLGERQRHDEIVVVRATWEPAAAPAQAAGGSQSPPTGWVSAGSPSRA